MAATLISRPCFTDINYKLYFDVPKCSAHSKNWTLFNNFQFMQGLITLASSSLKNYITLLSPTLTLSFRLSSALPNSDTYTYTTSPPTQPSMPYHPQKKTIMYTNLTHLLLTTRNLDPLHLHSSPWLLHPWRDWTARRHNATLSLSHFHWEPSTNLALHCDTCSLPTKKNRISS